MGSKRRFGITSDLSGLSQGLMVNNISFTEESQVAEARNQYGQLVDLAVYANDKNVTIDGLYLGDMLSGGSVINIGSEQYMVTSTARGETNIGFQTGTVNALRISGEFSPIPPLPPTPTEPSITFNIPNNIIWDFETNTTSSINFANYVAATPNSTGINYELTDLLYTTLPNGVVFNDGVLSANKSQMSDDYSTILSLNVSASFSGGTSLISTSPTFNFIVENVVEPVYNIPLTFKGLSSTNVICLSAHGTPDPIVLKAKINDGEWNSVTVDQNTYYTARLNQGDTIAFSGANDHFSTLGGNYYTFAMTGQIEAAGNIQSLMNYSLSCTEDCYSSLFAYCTSLKTAPKLPATTLADYCYQDMFYKCTSLTSAPALPATTLCELCYQDMFGDCTSLTSAPELPATNLARYCYDNMFNGCTSLTSAPELPATTLCGGCYYYMFGDCTSLTSAPKLPASILVGDCYWGMFAGCTSLTASPHLFNSQWDESCFREMFKNCTSLRKIYCNILSWLFFTNETTDWVKGVPNDGTYYGSMHLVPVQSQYYGVNKIPPYWTVVGIYP